MYVALNFSVGEPWKGERAQRGRVFSFTISSQGFCMFLKPEIEFTDVTFPRKQP
jgi:hypothetical protein